MKTFILISLILSLDLAGFAQETPTPPEKPTSSTRVSVSSSSSSNYDHSDAKNTGGNLSIAISESNDTYKLRAKFPSRNNQALKDLLLNEFGTKNSQRSGQSWTWTLESDNDEVYSIKLSSGKLRIELDKEQAASSLTEKFIRTGKEIKQLLSGKDNKRSQELQRKAQHLQRDAQRMQREAQRLKKQKGRKSINNEIEALRLKAKKLQQKVDSLQNELEKG